MHCFCCMAFCFALYAKLLRANRDESFLPIATSAVLNQMLIRALRSSLADSVLKLGVDHEIDPCLQEAKPANLPLSFA